MNTSRLLRSWLRPVLEPDGRVKDMLHAVDDSRAFWVLGDVHDAFHAQNICTAVIGQGLEKQAERCRGYRLVSQNSKADDVRGVPVGLVCVGMRSLAQPVAHVGGLAGEIVEAAIEQQGRINLALGCRQNWRHRIEGREATSEGVRGAIGEIGLGEHEPIGDRDLLH